MIRNKNVKTVLLICLDIILICISYLMAYYFRYDVDIKTAATIMELNVGKLIVAGVVYIGVFYVLKLYKSLWSFASLDEILNGTAAILIGVGINIGIAMVIDSRIPLLITILSAIFIFILCNGIRVLWRIVRRGYLLIETGTDDEQKKILIYGAGIIGSIVQRELKRSKHLNKKIVGFIDDDRQKVGRYMCGDKILGSKKDLVNIIKKEDIQELIIAIGNINHETKREIINICKNYKIKVSIMPPISEILSSDFNLSKIKEVDVKDLLGRDEIELDYSGISEYLKNKVVLVTGGGGSIGSELCRQIIKFKPEQLIIFDIYENNAYDIQNELLMEYPNIKLNIIIGSVRDRVRLNNLFNRFKPQIVFHAAAHKHVPLMEDSPGEAILNNAVGTMNLAEISKKHNVKKFVLISTDKAVNPTNVMGATKRLCEMIVQSLNKDSNTEFVAVRFGNVLGSNGSVIPLFKKQIAEGKAITLTHPDITRYFMLISEAAELVLQAGAFAKGGEIFVLDMGKPVKIYDLACDLIKLSGLTPYEDVDIKITGLRPGEKLYEELLMDEEGLRKTKHNKIFIGVPGEYEIDNLKCSINELIELNNRGQDKLIVSKLRDIVPTFKSPNIDNEVAITEEN